MWFDWHTEEVGSGGLVTNPNDETVVVTVANGEESPARRQRGTGTIRAKTGTRTTSGAFIFFIFVWAIRMTPCFFCLQVRRRFSIPAPRCAPLGGAPRRGEGWGGKGMSGYPVPAGASATVLRQVRRRGGDETRRRDDPMTLFARLRIFYLKVDLVEGDHISK